MTPVLTFDLFHANLTSNHLLVSLRDNYTVQHNGSITF